MIGRSTELVLNCPKNSRAQLSKTSNFSVIHKLKPKPKTKNQKPKTKNQKPKTKNQKPKTENQKPKTENRKPKTENRKPKTIPRPNMDNFIIFAE
jgi:hypothetical protein